MPKKYHANKGKKESHSNQDGESGKTGEYWQQGRKNRSGGANENWKQGPKNGSGNANGNPNQFPDMGSLTKGGCLPTLGARIKNAFRRSTSGGCLLQLSILLMPLLAVGAILFIAL